MSETKTLVISDFRMLPEYINARQKQETLVKENPFVEIIDTKTLKEAQQRRTALKSGRTELQKGEKLIASKLAEFRKDVKEETANLIAITLPYEEKQQAEINRYDEQRQKEREERARQERQRILKHQNVIKAFKEEKIKAINTATVKTIGVIMEDISNTTLDVEEFEDDFLTAKKEVLAMAEQKETNLAEAERLRIEREELERQRKEAEAERKRQEAERQRAEAEARKKRQVEEAKLKADREALAKQKAELDRKESERRKAEEARQKAQAEEARKRAEAEAKEEFERRKLILSDNGYTYDEETGHLTFGNLVIKKWEVEGASNEAFETALLPELKAMVHKEAARLEAIKPDKEKMLEVLSKIQLPQLALNSDKSNKVYAQITANISELVQNSIEYINEL
ncbi:MULTISPECIES: hypothetical protein [unclassified Carboxylicivirga]|uniref:hypothetical protein n=1 Tax=Carboxylicivirga TaxID=1628153 RepID=UPI003D33C73B